jgi:voltage-gated potassium channel
MIKIDFRLKFLLVAVIAIMLFGTIGFAFLEGLSLFNSFYFTFITVATVGYGDITPHTQAGRVLAMLVIVVGVGTFLGVVASGTEMLLEQREREARRQKLNMVLGLFFSEVGTDLLASFSEHDSDVEQIRNALLVTQQWKTEDFARVSKLLGGYKPRVDSRRVGLDKLKTALNERSDFFVRLFENPNLLEHESFTELLRALLHVKEELAHRRELVGLPDHDYMHLSGDINRAYGLLLVEWLDYMKYLEISYPYLFSLALRTNPFDKNASPIVQ